MKKRLAKLNHREFLPRYAESVHYPYRALLHPLSVTSNFCRKQRRPIWRRCKQGVAARSDTTTRAGQETLRNILHLAAFFSILFCLVDASAHTKCGRAGGAKVLWRMWSTYSPLSFSNASQKLEADFTMARRLDDIEDRAQRRS